jgi:hypothetical protein
VGVENEFERIRVPVEGNPSTDRVTVLRAVTHEGERFYCWTEENLTADHGIRLLAGLEAECIDDTSVERVRNETFQAWYFPPPLPELNPVEQCWDQLEAWFNYRLIDDLSHLQEELQRAIGEIDEPNLFNCLLPAKFESDLKTN